MSNYLAVAGKRPALTSTSPSGPAELVPPYSHSSSMLFLVSLPLSHWISPSSQCPVVSVIPALPVTSNMKYSTPVIRCDTHKLVVLDERKTVIRISKAKYSVIEDYIICLRRFVLVRNILKRVKLEAEEKSRAKAAAPTYHTQPSSLATAFQHLPSPSCTIFSDELAATAALHDHHLPLVPY